MENKTSESQLNATKKYLSKFTETKVRLMPEEHAMMTAHAKSMGESTAAFIKRAINETMERDNENKKDAE